MAIIYSYPEKTSPAGGDFLVITDSEQPAPNKNRTKSLTIDNLASYITTSTSGITGSGTLNTIAMFTPDSQAIGDSPMFKLPGADWVQVGVVGSGQETVLGPGFVSTTVLGVTNVQAADGGSVTLQGNVEIGNASTDTCIIDSTVTLFGPVKDRNNALGTTSQILVSNASSQLEWTDIADIQGSVTGSGTTNTLPVWTDGPNGVLGDSMITQNSSGSIATVAGRLAVNTDLSVTGYARFNGQVQDGSNSPGTTGQVLTSTGTGVAWDDAADVVSGAVAKLIPYVTTATPGGSETYTALNNIAKIGWSGGNGIYVINLPSATAIPYRNIRFTTNGTYPGGGAHKVRFTATGGETIDGAAYYEISKAYEGISVWSTGTEWVVIQAKAH